MTWLVGVPRHILPEVRDTTGPFCSTDAKTFGAVIPVNVVVGEKETTLVTGRRTDQSKSSGREPHLEMGKEQKTEGK